MPLFLKIITAVELGLLTGLYFLGGWSAVIGCLLGLFIGLIIVLAIFYLIWAWVTIQERK